MGKYSNKLNHQVVENCITKYHAKILNKVGKQLFKKESSQKGAFDIYSVPKKNLLFKEFG